jgi:hypothetical protein
MAKNVMIPLLLLDRIIELLDGLEPPEYHELRYDYCDITWALQVKKQKLELRDAYAKIISAGCMDARDDARIEYLRQKNCLENLAEGDVIF